MNIQKLFLGILGLGVISGLIFVVVKLNNKIMEEGNVDNSTELPTQSGNNGASPSPEFGKTITLKLSDSVAFSDGLNVILKEINDSRCPKDVQCIWAGEISGVFSVSGGKLTLSKEIRLGTANSKSMTFENYTFSLKNATGSSITIIVEYKKPEVSSKNAQFY